jgi:hypothetical protein
MRDPYLSNHRIYVPNSRAPISRKHSLTAAAICSVVLLLLALYSRPQAVMAGTPRPLQEARSNSTAQILAHSLQLTREHGYLVLTGEARNVTRREMPQMEAIVEFFDEAGRLVAFESGLVKTNSILAGDESPFQVQAPDHASFASYRVRFRRIAGPLVPSQIEA